MTILDFDPWAEIAESESEPTKVANPAKAPDPESRISHLSQPNTQERCERCQELESRGVRTLICSACGFHAKLPEIRPTPDDLKYSLDLVRRELPDLSRRSRGLYDYWLELTMDAGWDREEAERGAFRRSLTSMPSRILTPDLSDSTRGPPDDEGQEQLEIALKPDKEETPNRNAEFE